VRTLDRRFPDSSRPGTTFELIGSRHISGFLDSCGRFAIVAAKSSRIFPVYAVARFAKRVIHQTNALNTRWPEYARAELVGRVFQNPFSGTSPSLSIRENLSLAARRGRSRGLGWSLKPSLLSGMRDQVSRLNMGLEDRLENAIGSLSGGQRQALTLLMATWLRPELLLLDEHTAALDPKSADLLIALTEKVVASEKLTTLMVTHSMQQGASLGDRLIMMHRGQIIHNLQGAEKRRLRPEDLLTRFEEVRRAEQLDESAAQMLAEKYI